MKLQEERLKKKDKERKQRLEEQKRRQEEEELKAKQLAKQKEKKDKILAKQLEAITKKRHHAKATHLKSLKVLYHVQLLKEPSFIQLQNTIYMAESRIPDIFPKYNSKWLQMIHKILPSYSFLDLPKIGYYKELNISCPRFPEVTYYRDLPEELQLTFKQEYEFFYKVIVDLDIDMQIYGLQKEIEMEYDDTVEVVKDPSKGKGMWRGRTLDEILESMDFNTYVDIEFIRQEFGGNIQREEEERYMLV